VLEIGCGTGRILIPTARIGIECIGLDSSPEMLALLLDKNPPANLQLVNGPRQVVLYARLISKRSPDPATAPGYLATA
jgi:SAM-dependent methyltransferase